MKQKITWPKSSSGPLKNLRVLDLSRVLAGPLCAQHLADLGAAVIKVEDPVRGDETRSWGPPFVDGVSAYFLSCNRGKRFVALDLKSPEGQATLEVLIKSADVVIENFLPSRVKKLGLEVKKLRRLNPRLIVCSISGFGRTSKWADTPGYDFIVQGLSGLMSITGEEGRPPVKVGVAVADVLTSLYASTAIGAALHQRTLTGKGAHLDVSLLNCVLAAQVNVLQAHLTSGKPPRRWGNAHGQIVPYQAFTCKDGQVILAVGNDRQFAAFCGFLKKSEWAKDPRFQSNPKRVLNRTTLCHLIQSLLKRRSVETVVKLCQAAGVPAGPVLAYEDFDRSPVLREWKGKASPAKGPKMIPSPFVVDGKIQQAKYHDAMMQPKSARD